MSLSRQRKGVIITVLGVVFVTPDAALVRWAKSTGASIESIVFYKLIAMAAVVYAFTFVERSEGAWLAARRKPVAFLVMGLTYAVSIVLHSYSFVLTFAAIAILCYSMHPLFSAVFGRIFLKEVLPRPTILALLGAVLSLVVMFAPEIFSGGGSRSGGMVGDVFALLTAVLTAAFLTAARATSTSSLPLSPSLASAVGLLITAVALALFSSQGSSFFAGPSSPFYVACSLDGLSVGAVNVAFAVAPAYITGAEIGLLSLIETVFGPVWVFFCFAEVPPVSSLIGGAMIVLVLAGHELFANKTLDEQAKLVVTHTAVPTYTQLTTSNP